MTPLVAVLAFVGILLFWAGVAFAVEALDRRFQRRQDARLWSHYPEWTDK